MFHWATNSADVLIFHSFHFTLFFFGYIIPSYEPAYERICGKNKKDADEKWDLKEWICSQIEDKVIKFFNVRWVIKIFEKIAFMKLL